MMLDLDEPEKEHKNKHEGDKVYNFVKDNFVGIIIVLFVIFAIVAVVKTYFF